MMQDAARQRRVRFAEIYLTNGFNGKAAYMAVNPDCTESTASGRSQAWLRDPLVVSMLQEAQQQSTERLQVTMDRIVEELACAAFLDPADLLDDDGNVRPIGEIPEHARRAISGLDVLTNASTFGVTKKLKLESKQGALTLLGKNLGMFVDRVKTENETTINHTVSSVDLAERIEQLTGESSGDVWE